MTLPALKKLSRLPRRSALIVAFSAEEVYATAEMLRRLRGGAAVVMGAVPAHQQRAGRDVPGGRGRRSCRDRRDRHGAEPRRRACRLRRADQV
ncbi:hypothetical protein AB5I41_21370 [Sphingomonas sp. MMS24-JH45]